MKKSIYINIWLSLLTLCDISRAAATAVAATPASEIDVEFKHVVSAYKPTHWIGTFTKKSWPMPAVSTSDLLAFNTVHLETEKIYYKQDEKGGPVRDGTGKLVKTYETEVGTSFIVWGRRKGRKYSFREFYEDNIGEPFLFTCDHCVHEYTPSEKIKAYNLSFHYIDLKKKLFYILTMRLPNTSTKKVPWFVREDHDMALLPIGELLEKGKEYMDVHYPEGNHYPFFRGIMQSGADSDYPEDLGRYGYLSNVIMFGYPYEVYNASYNLPLARFGHCATDPKHKASIANSLDFYTDIAAISGSSGSPLWFYSKKLEVYQDDDTKEITIEEESTYKFAGMLFAGAEDSNDHTVHLGCITSASQVKSLEDAFYDTILLDDGGAGAGAGDTGPVLGITGLLLKNSSKRGAAIRTATSVAGVGAGSAGAGAGAAGGAGAGAGIAAAGKP